MSKISNVALTRTTSELTYSLQIVEDVLKDLNTSGTIGKKSKKDIQVALKQLDHVKGELAGINEEASTMIRRRLAEHLPPG